MKGFELELALKQRRKVYLSLKKLQPSPGHNPPLKSL